MFLTAHAEYAVEAAALHAAGYMLKPVSLERLQKEVDYIMGQLRLRRAAAPPAHQVVIQTFSEFDVFVDRKTVAFSRSRAKELLAYLVDRQGSSITRASAHAVLWEEGEYTRSMQKQLDVVIRSLKDTLSEYGISEIFEQKRGSLRVRPEKFSCDLYRFLAGNSAARKAFKGEYMSAYSWASLTEAYLNRISSRVSEE